MVAHAYSLAIWETEAGRSLEPTVGDQPGQHNEAMSEKERKGVGELEPREEGSFGNWGRLERLANITCGLSMNPGTQQDLQLFLGLFLLRSLSGTPSPLQCTPGFRTHLPSL
jgi:hypothetical protein